jgi:hypothetical protein
MPRAWRPLCAFCLAFLACRSGGEKHTARPRPAASTAGLDSPAPSAAPGTSTASTSDPSSSAFVLAFTRFSESGARFRGDNLISNEGAYLDVASELASRSGGVYLGVGPEQNFSYIALSRPELAVIVDIRRDNALLHLLYKAIFETARDRSEFLCTLLTRKCAPLHAPPPGATIESILAHVGKTPPDREGFEFRHSALAELLRSRSALGLSEADFAAMERLHRELLDRGLDAHFEGQGPPGLRHPTLAELLRSRGADGKLGSFLSSDALFRTVQDLQRQDRVQFVVGDFGQVGALRRIAEDLNARSLVLRTFYVSNVEQYLFKSKVWATWLENLRAFPIDSETRLLRSYISSARPHPAQREGERTASFTTRLRTWLNCEERKPSKDYFTAISRPECGNPRPQGDDPTAATRVSRR